MSESIKKYVIAHDVGTSSSKAVIIDTSGNIISSEAESYPTQFPEPGKVEQNPEDYWNAVSDSTKRVLASSGINPAEVIGIVFTTQAMGIIPVDSGGNVLHPNITWVDGRAEKQAERIMNMFLGRRIFKLIVGIELTGKDVLAKLIWLKENKRDIYNKTESILDVNGFLKFKATGKKVFEWSGACSYTFDLKKKDWTRIFFKLIGFDMKKLPPLVRSVDMVGGLTSEAASNMGLLEGTPVYGGCDDTQSASVGSGSIGEGEAHIYLGTSAWVAVTTSSAPKFKNGAVALQSADPEKNIVVGITESAGANLDWLIDNFYRKEKEELGEQKVYNLVDKEGLKTPPGADYMLFTPWMLGERCPVSSTTTRGTLFNLDPSHSRGHVARALLEGIAFNLRWIIENMEKDFGFKIPVLRVIGGGAGNNHWMQVISDITGRNIITTNQSRMAGAIGAASIVLVGSGKCDSFDVIHKFVKPDKKFVPNRSNDKVYNTLFKQYKRVYKSLRKIYVDINTKRFSTDDGRK